MARIACFINAGAALSDAVTLAGRADTLGYDSVWTTHGLGRDALLVLGAYGAAAPRIGLGSGVIPIYPRHPVLLAQEALTLADVTGGRVRLGIGAGRNRSTRHSARISGPAGRAWTRRSGCCAPTGPTPR